MYIRVQDLFYCGGCGSILSLIWTFSLQLLKLFLILTHLHSSLVNHFGNRSHRINGNLLYKYWGGGEGGEGGGVVPCHLLRGVLLIASCCTRIL